MAPYHAFAQEALNILRYLARDMNICDNKAQEKIDRLVGIPTRNLGYLRPLLSTVRAMEEAGFFLI